MNTPFDADLEALLDDLPNRLINLLRAVRDTGYNAGFVAAKSSNVGDYDRGYYDGRDEGYQAGFREGKELADKQFHLEDYWLGYDVGREEGREELVDFEWSKGREAGYEEGYAIGLEAGKEYIKYKEYREPALQPSTVDYSGRPF